MSLEKINIDGIVSAAAKANPRRENDFERDGLLFCGNCRTPKQCRVTVCGEERIVPCMCECRQRAYNAALAEDAQKQERIRISALRTSGLMETSMRDMRFERDDGRDAKTMNMARRYVERFDKIERENVGLLLWGNTGNGKIFIAVSIANALIDKGVPVLMTSFPRILATVQGMYQDGRQAYLDELRNYRLLIIDDLGAERQSEYAMELVYSVIDARANARRPLIITTNHSLGEMQKAQNIAYQRIYDRVLAMCVPVQYKGESRRTGIAAEKVAAAREILS